MSRRLTPGLAALLAILAVGCGGGSATNQAASYHSARDSRHWPVRWCEVSIGDSRESVVRAMRSYPTEEDSHKIPLIPPMHFNSRGEPVTPRLPQPAGSDTWQTGGYEFNAFYDRSLHVQQLDFAGPALPCAAIRVR